MALPAMMAGNKLFLASAHLQPRQFRGCFVGRSVRPLHRRVELRGGLEAQDFRRHHAGHLPSVIVPWRSSTPCKRSNLARYFIGACLPTRADKAPLADGWVHEIKHDGSRLRIHARKDRVRLDTRSAWTGPTAIPGLWTQFGHAVIDAECVCC